MSSIDYRPVLVWAPGLGADRQTVVRCKGIMCIATCMLLRSINLIRLAVLFGPIYYRPVVVWEPGLGADRQTVVWCKRIMCIAILLRGINLIRLALYIQWFCGVVYPVTSIGRWTQVI